MCLLLSLPAPCVHEKNFALEWGNNIFQKFQKKKKNGDDSSFICGHFKKNQVGFQKKLVCAPVPPGAPCNFYKTKNIQKLTRNHFFIIHDKSVSSKLKLCKGPTFIEKKTELFGHKNRWSVMRHTLSDLCSIGFVWFPT